MDPVTIRALERILVVIFSGLSIYLGYRLFLHIPSHKDAEGKVTLPGGVSIYMTRVGPGAFFALFGAVVLSLSFRYSINYSQTAPAAHPSSAKAEVAGASVNYSGMQPRGGDSGAAEMERLQVRGDFDFLDRTLPGLLRPDVKEDRRKQLDLVISRAKLAEMKAVWDPEWGSFEDFRSWVERGGAEPAPDNAHKAVAWMRR